MDTTKAEQGRRVYKGRGTRARTRHPNIEVFEIHDGSLRVLVPLARGSAHTHTAYIVVKIAERWRVTFPGVVRKRITDSLPQPLVRRSVGWLNTQPGGRMALINIRLDAWG